MEENFTTIQIETLNNGRVRGDNLNTHKSILEKNNHTVPYNTTRELHSDSHGDTSRSQLYFYLVSDLLTGPLRLTANLR